MQTIGAIFAAAGALVYMAGVAIQRKNKQALEQMRDAGDDERTFMDLIRGGMLMVKIIGAVLIATGALFIFLS